MCSRGPIEADSYYVEASVELEKSSMLVTAWVLCE